MHKTEPIDKRVYLRCSDGKLFVYESYGDFIKIESLDDDYYRNRLVLDLEKWKHGGWREQFEFPGCDFRCAYDVYVLTTPSGGYTFDPEKIWDDLCGSRFHARSYYWMKNPYEFRRDPVPGTGGRNWHFGSYYRNPKTTQEMRYACYHGRLVRARRNKNNLPDPWDDIQRGDVGTRKSWKNKKNKKQWMKNRR